MIEPFAHIFRQKSQDAVSMLLQNGVFLPVAPVSFGVCRRAQCGRSREFGRRMITAASVNAELSAILYLVNPRIEFNCNASVTPIQASLAYLIAVMTHRRPIAPFSAESSLPARVRIVGRRFNIVDRMRALTGGTPFRLYRSHGEQHRGRGK
jgi:hypothetical protein